MNMNGYFERIKNAIDSMSDEEFDLLLVESGIENCPFEELELNEFLLYDELRKNIYYVNDLSENINCENITIKQRLGKINDQLYNNATKFTYDTLNRYSIYDCNIDKVA